MQKTEVREVKVEVDLQDLERMFTEILEANNIVDDEVLKFFFALLFYCPHENFETILSHFRRSGKRARAYTEWCTFLTNHQDAKKAFEMIRSKEREISDH